MDSLHVRSVDLQSSDASHHFVKSLQQTGFAVLHEHPIDMNLVNEVYSMWSNFFISTQKHNYLFHNVKQDGYFPFKSENAKGSDEKDLKEFFHIYPWGRCPELLETKTRKLYSQLVDLACQLLKWIEKEVPIEISSNFSIPLEKMIEDSPQNLLRIINYPAISGSEKPNAVRAAAHEDINLITVLCAGTESGLQAQDVDGNWHDIQCDPGSIAVNTGDMLQMCSNNYFPSTTHRVINPEGDKSNVARMSMPLFLHPKDDVVLSMEHTAGTYLFERLQEIGLK
ncbi:MAG: isopenicillin N synthase family oxygenase [Candidatus Marinimicrobia bacterium]|jgi:isopenicillin N synthase-like dioxygenase|nr:isopenicillin N synthase family oxygenase [Candidatus Neomarinimicrobiota bacterium]MBT6870670.1 isopenicillin N synthase family oxygenase [Candidatus Neomarinimicrobiota bacterium]MBT7377699.1 isopenicillin N synthase family oxygenase [Candidatus Neomarinimicrobiota bacterium]|tara:strand:+ start:12534 stop:13379 length:846 start_codon:yes stop_codon:yes gene_type:complete